MPFKSSIDSWATLDSLWEEVVTGSRERAAFSDHPSPHEATSPSAAEEKPKTLEENRE